MNHASRFLLDPEEQRRREPPLPALREQLVWSQGGVRIGRFRAYPDDPHFRRSGPPGDRLIVFPKTSVWIEHSGEEPFVADRNCVTLYNPDCDYARSAVSDRGDHGNWFAFDREMVDEALHSVGVAAGRSARLPVSRATSEASLFEHQSTLVGALEAGAELDPVVVTERSLGFLLTVLRSASQDRRTARRAPPKRAHVQLAERAREEIAASYRGSWTVEDLAQRVGCSTFHLCRVFRAVTGRSIHRHRNELRVRRALLDIVDPEVRLVDVAHELGFSSHSHFSEVFRKLVGRPPRARTTESC